jgi:hypothetical protein
MKANKFNVRNTVVACKNKFNEKYQPFHLSLDKDSECKAGLYYQVKLDKIK